MDAGTEAIVSALKDSEEPQDQILVRIFTNSEGNRADIAHQSRRLDAVEAQLRRIISAQMATETLQPAKTFNSIAERFKRYRVALACVGVLAAFGFALHFVQFHPNFTK